MTDNQKTIDAPSYLSQFGWEKVGNDDLAIPVIVRSNGTRYAPVRIVEQEIIKKFNSLPQTLFQCITLKSFYIMQSEAKLLNSINFNHCNSRYGEAFFTQKDVIISANDVRELKRYLTTSNEIFNQDLGKFAPRLGIVDIALDPYNPAYKSHVPYLGKGKNQLVMHPKDHHLHCLTLLFNPPFSCTRSRWATIRASESNTFSTGRKQFAIHKTNSCINTK